MAVIKDVMGTLRACDTWAQREFGDAKLGDVRRTQRLVLVAAQAAATPAGKVTEVFTDVAPREGAFRLLENDDVDAKAIALAAHQETARRCASADGAFAFVPIDGSSLNLTDRNAAKGLGVVGTRSIGARGLCVMTAIAVAANGTPVGLCGQEYWARKKRVRRKCHRRRTEDKETQRWLDVMGHVSEVFTAQAKGTKPWFQVDRGGDAWPVLLHAVQSSQLLTARSAHNRRLKTSSPNTRYLWQEVTGQDATGTYFLEVPAAPKRQRRTAMMELRFRPVTLDLKDLRSKKSVEAALWAVHVREVETTPAGEEPIEWMLLTTYPVHDVEDAKLVLFGYAQRWRIEEFHKIWKTGACRVEENQLREYDHIVRWAVILASVAMRILRLTYLARTTPEAPATVEFSAAELDAIVIMAKKRDRRKRTPIPTINQAVQWLAKLGGYTGRRSSGGPPGALVIARGLRRIEPLAQVISDGELNK